MHIMCALFYTHDCSPCIHTHTHTVSCSPRSFFRHLFFFQQCCVVQIHVLIMSINKPPLIVNDNIDHYKRKKIVQIYNPIKLVYEIDDDYDLRLIILRHAERIDHILGYDWYNKVFGGAPLASRQAYEHPALPQRLPHRSITLLYAFDPPITSLGEKQAFEKGLQLSRTGATVDYCYSSPASRSILTANAILNGMNCARVPLRLEPYLFEPMNWNSTLSMLGEINPFMSTSDWKQSGYNIDQNYQRLGNYLNILETETNYYNRSRNFFQAIEHRHGKTAPQMNHRYFPKRPKTILIVGHASSTEIFSTIALRQPFNSKILGEQSSKVSYLHTVVLERDAINRIWRLRHFMYFV